MVSPSQPAEREDRASGRFFTAEELGLDLSLLPSSDDQAAERYAKWREEDPFPDIDPALLNSADLFDYIAETGMIHPFPIDPSRVDKTLKPASCGIQLGGESVFWAYADDGAGELVEKKLTLNGESVLTLPPNSIVYATLAPTFRLPNYIAARFNLTIKYVYRGLLVGTGPLVDPGFNGSLQLPIHNLTSDDCHIPTRDIVVWMEFTKLSRNDEWTRAGSEPRSGRYVPFPERKQHRDLASYLKEANSGEPIVSSIPAIFNRTSVAAEKSAAEAKKTRRVGEIFQIATVLGVIGVLVTVGALLFDLQGSIRSDADTALHRSNSLEAELNETQDQLDALREQMKQAQPSK